MYGVLGTERAKRVTALWNSLDAKTKARVLDAFHKMFDAVDVIFDLEDDYGALAKSTLTPEGRPTTAAGQLAAIIPKGRDYRHPMLSADWQMCLKDGDLDGVLFVVSPANADQSPTELALAVGAVKNAQWLMESSDTPEARKAFSAAGKVFKLTGDDRLFCANFEVVADAIEWVSKAPELVRQGGMHRHVSVNRDKQVTSVDGAHMHYFIVDGELVTTADDGAHSHKLYRPAANITATDGAHAHRVAHGDTDALTTELDGTHAHQLAIEMTGFDGLHQHELELPDGRRVFSLLPAQTWALHAEDESPATTAMSATTAKSIPGTIRLVKAGEERFVFGIVLEPNDGDDGAPLDPDAQSDVYSAEEIREAAHTFLAEYGNIGLQHEGFINGAVKILESYIAPDSFSIAGTEVRKGTWLLAIRIVDDELWRRIKVGEFTGFSIGGSAVRRPTDETA